MSKSDIYEVSGFSFSYPSAERKIVLEGSFTVEESSTVLISGNSGSGKSTLLYALKGLIPDVIFGKLSGVILFRGETVSNMWKDPEKRIGIIFQNPSAQMVCPSVMNELAFGMENLKMKPGDIIDKIYYYADLFKIQHLLNRKTEELSGGEKQAIALLSIAAMDCSVYLFDEPTAFLDPERSSHFIDVLGYLMKNKTVIIVEHNLKYLTGKISSVLHIENRVIQKKENIILQTLPVSKRKKSPGKEVMTGINICHSYNMKNTVLKNLDFSLHEGEVLGVAGNNGTGKSTLLKIISRILSPLSGKIIFQGKDISAIPKKEYYQHLSLLYQNPESHFLYSTALQEVQGNTAALEKFNLIDYRDSNPFTLSEGEKRRLTLAMQWSMNRRIYLLDEPSFGMDFGNKLILIETINRMADDGCSFIIVSHDNEFLQSVSDRRLLLIDGAFEPFIDTENL